MDSCCFPFPLNIHNPVCKYVTYSYLDFILNILTQVYNTWFSAHLMFLVFISGESNVLFQVLLIAVSVVSLWSAFVISHSGGLNAPVLIHLASVWHEDTLTMHHTIINNGLGLQAVFPVPHTQSNPPV